MRHDEARNCVDSHSLEPSQREWRALASGLRRGEARSVQELSLRVARMFSAWRAHDFRDDWDDLIQDVLLAATLALREGRIREVAAFAGYVRATARNRLLDRLRKHANRREDETAEWSVAEAGNSEAMRWYDRCPASRVDVGRLLCQLPPPIAALVYKVHAEQRTYREAAAETGIPLGTAKRYLRVGMQELRARCEPPLSPATCS